ncbi:DHA2 family efflux MFS transporter permease subunit [Arsenicitalea aurantiaca]|uniref:DHA2 family efflux MFS transporter permease subunit n=1 Tax=Arsenicitalea aurantiaca TaxID=1783274 RepID=UPI001FCEB581|nr:DHA2 family efflux MFS transporter permease subunit [Arsenicitalea aurantiaca]
MNRLTPLILAVALFMEQMDSTVIATSLPAIAADIGTEPIALKLAFTAYFVALAIFIPVSGWMADRWGARNVFRGAIGVFVIGSLCCAFADSLQTFVMSRFLQGIGASMMTPIARLLLIRATPRNQLVGAMAWLTLPGLIGPLAGPPLGGFLTTYFSWHWIFIINVPIGLIGIVLVTRFLPKTEARLPRPIDFKGFLLAAIAFSGLIFGLSVVSLPALPIMAGLGALCAGVVATILYLRHARRTEFPLLDPRVFRNRLFASTVLGGSLFRIGIGAIPFLLPLMLQLGFGLNAFESGMITFVGAIGALTSKFVAERIYARFGFRRVLIVAGLGSALLIMAKATFYPETPIALIMGVLLVGGLLRSIFFTGINALGYADIEDTEASQATAISAVSQQISIALGVAVAGSVLELTTHMHAGGLGLVDFHVAFLVVGGLSALAALVYMRLPADAGSAVSGHVVRKRKKTG